MQKVIVGMSGGVDSSVSAYLLLEQGYQVEGLFMKNWEEDDDDIYCSAADDLNDAQQVCDHLNIPLHKINFASEYWDSVFEYFLAEYKAGRTPNPDVLCNKEIKFKAFLDYALNHLHADWIAMGHYARVCHFTDGTPTQLLRGVDANKDQTYFLNALTHTQLSRALFPIGELQKPQVREIASEQGLITAKKKDSTGICFIGERQFKTFLATYLPAQPGHIETTDGTLLGTHQGLMYHTLGQRKGLGIGGVHDALEEAWYVVDKDLKRNVLIVGQGADHPRLKSKGCFVNQLNFIDETTVTEPRQCTVKTRYRQQDIPCTLYPVATAETENDMIYVRFDDEQIAVTPGQSAVFYQDERCLGGGVIDQRFSHAEDEQLLYSNNKTGLTHITYESKVI